MTAEQISVAVSAAIPFFLGLYGTLLSYRIIGRKPGQSSEYDRWLNSYGRFFRFGGPFLMIVGLCLLAGWIQ
jgi:hypothetical protein